MRKLTTYVTVASAIFLSDLNVLALKTDTSEAVTESVAWRNTLERFLWTYQKLGISGGLPESQRFQQALEVLAQEMHLSVPELLSGPLAFSSKVNKNPGFSYYFVALADFSKRRFNEAAQNAQKAAEEFRNQKAPTGEEGDAFRRQRALSLILAGASLSASGSEPTKAEAVFDEACTVVSPEDLQTSHIVNCCRISFLLQSKQVDRAISALKERLEVESQKQGSTDQLTLETAYQFAAQLSNVGQLREAEQLFRETLQKQRALLGANHVDCIATMTDFGLLLKSMNKLPEAEELLQSVLNHAEANYSPNSAWVGRCLNNLSIVLRSKGELVRAEAYQRRVIQIDADQFGKDSMELAPDYTNLGNTLLGQARLQEAIDALSECIRINELHPEKDRNHSFASALRTMAIISFKQRKPDVAKAYAERSNKAMEQQLGPDSPELIDGYNTLSIVYGDLGDFWEAEIECKKGLRIAEKCFGKESSAYARSLQALGMILMYNARPTEGRRVFSEALEIVSRVLGPDSSEALELKSYLARPDPVPVPAPKRNAAGLLNSPLLDNVRRPK